MDTATIIVGLALGVIAIIPFLLSVRSRRRKKNHLFNIILNKATANNSKITAHEYFGNLIVGIDKLNSIIYLVRKGNKKEVIRSIKLKDIKKSSIESIKRSVNFKGGSTEIIDRLFYALSH